MVMPVTECLTPHQILPAGATIMETSFLNWQSLTRTNQAQVSSVVSTLKAGLWDIEMLLCTQFNWLGTLALAFGAIAQFDFSGGALVQRAIVRPPTIGAFVDRTQQRILARENFTISITVGLTGVGQTTDVYLTLNAKKIL